MIESESVSGGNWPVGAFVGWLKADLIILDLNIPRMDGYTVMERLGQISTPIIAFTSSIEGTERAFALGAREIVQKPSDFSAFIETVCKIADTWVGRAARTGAPLPGSTRVLIAVSWEADAFRLARA